MQRPTAAPHDSRRPPGRLRLALTILLTAVLVVATPPTAWAVGPTQRLLCDGYTARTCAVTTDSTVAANGQILRVGINGNAGVDVALQFYAIEFNAQGEATGLVPSGPVSSGLVTGPNGLSNVAMVPRTVLDVPGGWGFVGLADDDSIDLRTRLGQVVELGGRTLKLLGDGYAEQKPVGVELDLHVLGNIYGLGYWIEYLDDDGEWTAVPGHGYGQSQRLRTSPGEISHLTYTVPQALTEGQPYQFRINHHMNYEGGPNRPIAAPAFAEWTVVPSEHGQARARGAQLDPSKAPGKPDPDDEAPQAGAPSGGAPQAGAPTAGAPGGEPTAQPSDASAATPTADPTTQPTVEPSPSTDPVPSGDDAPEPAREADAPAEPEQSSSASASPAPDSASASASPSESVSPSPSASPSASPSPSASAGSAAAAPSPSASAAGGTPGGTVWGDEAGVVPAARVEATGAPLRWGLGALLLLVALAPLGVRLLQHRTPAVKESW